MLSPRRLQGDAPGEAVLAAHQVLQKEAAHAGVVDLLGQQGVGFGAPVDAATGRGRASLRHRRGRCDGRRPARCPPRPGGRPARRAPAPDASRPCRPCCGRSTAADAQSLARQERAHVVGHLVVGHLVRPGRGAVIAQVEREDAMGRTELPGEARPVARRAEQAVQDQDRRAAFAVRDMGKLEAHGRSVRPRRARMVSDSAARSTPHDKNRAVRVDSWRAST